jgi:hypothetical protein
MQIGGLQLNLKRIGVFIGLGILLFLVMDFNARMDELTRLQNEAGIVHAQATAVMVAQLKLQTQVAHATSDDAVAQWAREQARMAQSGDQVIVPLPAPGTTPQPTPTPETPVADLTKWDVWMHLFFGQ